MKLHELLGIKYPLIQGGMANIATGEFAAAVSNTGALGMIGAGGMSADMLREQIQICKQHTQMPFGVNLMLMNPDTDKMAEIVIEEQVPVVTTGAGNPGKYMKQWKSAGIKVFPVVASVGLARRMERLGADGVIAEGCESGGHVGETTTMVLVPQVADAVNIPVIAAGGIASGRQMVAAEVLGACGVQVGTCLLSTTECPIHENYKQAVRNARDTHITVMGRIAGTPVRVIKNDMVREYIAREKEGATLMELEHYTLGSLRRAVKEGDIETGSVMAGQTAAMIHDECSLVERIETLFTEYETVLKELCR
ncbi:nitronate monooxygenase [Filifactor alocis]|uniref:nitronate monooxygenase n=1 Tax=Filifactor alocis TaxID=143361 RepID=UPI003C6FA92D